MTEKIIVRGGRKLSGAVEIEGAKNAALPLLAATLLAGEGEVILHNVPILTDVHIMNDLIAHLGVGLSYDEASRTVYARAATEVKEEAPYRYVSRMRASMVVMGPLLARKGRAKISLPGGCSIGDRPIDLHLRGFELMGVSFKQQSGYIDAQTEHLHGARIYLDFPSVGATQNIMMAATLADGVTYIENAAREPEIVDLANLLNRMGAQVRGAGTDLISIRGVAKLHGVEHSVVQDRIEAGTFIVAAAITQGDVLIRDAISEHNRPLISKLMGMGVRFKEEDEGLRVLGPEKLKPNNVKTFPHPGFPTDMQAQMTIAQAAAQGESIMVETVFENRFQHLIELRRMGLDTDIVNNRAVIQGGGLLQGAEVKATDLRAAAALILAGLIAEGETTVLDLQYLDRGYYNFHGKLASLGADIERLSE